MNENRDTRLPPHLWDIQREIEGHARAFGLDFYETIFEVLGYDEINMVASYGGFPNRYPHWRFGMEYEQLSKGYEYGLSKIYEMVINNNPSYAYLLESNMDVDQKLVMAHVYGHVDFFKNNFSFQHTNRKMMDEMANHATRVRRIIDRVGIEAVETFIDRCLSLENLINQHAPHFPAKSRDEPEEKPIEVRGFKFNREYMGEYINPQSFLQAERKKLEDERAQKKKFPEKPERDVLAFLIEHAPLERWEADVLSVIREEAYYFAPQGQTKICNEGWACVAADSLVFTAVGLLPMRAVVEGQAKRVSDGEKDRHVYGQNVIRDHQTIALRTAGGFRLTGSNNHRVLRGDGSWARLDELRLGDKLRLSGGNGLWPQRRVPLDWMDRQRYGRPLTHGGAALQLSPSPIAMPDEVSPDLGALAGLLLGGELCFAARETAEQVVQVARDLFGVLSSVELLEGGRQRVFLPADAALEFLEAELSLSHGRVPDAILRSPREVVAPFLRAIFDRSGNASGGGVVLEGLADELCEDVQLLLLNFGILARRSRTTLAPRSGDGALRIEGQSALRYAGEIGFGVAEKREALAAYCEQPERFGEEEWQDEVSELVAGRADVYDISVEQTHRYAACGFVNHNSYWHSTIMTTKALKDSEIIDYADHHSGTMGVRPGAINPYKLGIELWRHIEDRWNRGRFGKEYDECDDLRARRAWDRKLGLGRQKIFEVRKHYNDITFIDEFLTAEFAAEQKLFVYGFNEKGNRWEILDREFQKVKKKLLQQLTNFGQPIIEVVDGNFENRGELLLAHRHDGVDLRVDYAKDTLVNLQAMWRRPVAIVTRFDNKGVLLRFDGRDHSDRKVEL
jgi:stage V sporulation protein R